MLPRQSYTEIVGEVITVPSQQVVRSAYIVLGYILDQFMDLIVRQASITNTNGLSNKGETGLTTCVSTVQYSTLHYLNSSPGGPTLASTAKTPVMFLYSCPPKQYSLPQISTPE